MTEKAETQSDKLKAAAREHGAYENEKRWEERSKKVAEAKPAKSA